MASWHYLPSSCPLRISCGAAIAVQKITGLTVNLQDSLVYSYKPPNPSGRPEEGSEPVNPYPYLIERPLKLRPAVKRKTE
jgi:hypothetical protein